MPGVQRVVGHNGRRTRRGALRQFESREHVPSRVRRHGTVCVWRRAKLLEPVHARGVHARGRRIRRSVGVDHELGWFGLAGHNNPTRDHFHQQERCIVGVVRNWVLGCGCVQLWFSQHGLHRQRTAQRFLFPPPVRALAYTAADTCTERSANSGSNVSTDRGADRGAHCAPHGCPNRFANGIADGAANGIADQSANGITNRRANGIADRTANGIADRAANGIADTSTNGVAHHAANGIANCAANGIANCAANGIAYQAAIDVADRATIIDLFTCICS